MKRNNNNSSNIIDVDNVSLGRNNNNSNSRISSSITPSGSIGVTKPGINI